MAHHYISIGPFGIVLSGKWPFWRRGKKVSPALLCDSTYPSKHWTITQCYFNAGPASKAVGWFNIETAVGEWNVFADVLAQSIDLQQTQCCISGGPASWTIDRHRTSDGLRRWPNIEPEWGW